MKAKEDMILGGNWQPPRFKLRNLEVFVDDVGVVCLQRDSKLERVITCT